jgi:predicted dehydrogenase
MSEKFHLGLVGCGDFGKYIGRYFLEVADIAALCDVNAAGMEETAKALDLDVPRYTDYRKMFAGGGLDGVIITAANFVHAKITVAAAEAGLHVFCEKAMARTVPECWEMVRACQENNVKLMIGHKRRLRPPWARMIELTDEALLGEVLAVTVTQYADIRPYKFFNTWWADPELSGGFFQMHGVHVIDWFRAICGDAKKVTALYGPQHDARYKYPDIVHATFQFESGALASINGGLSYPLHQFRESQGPWGECRHGGFKLVPYMDHIDLYWQRLDEDEAHHERFDDLGYDHAFRLETSDFVRWVQEDRPPCLTWVEGLRCVEMMEAAYRSAEGGGQLIELPLYPELEEEKR